MFVIDDIHMKASIEMKHLSKTTYSTGTEQEKTGQWSTKTVFVSGSPDAATVDQLIQDTMASHVHIQLVASDAAAVQLVRDLIDRGISVTAEYPAGDQGLVETSLAAHYRSDRLTPVAVVTVDRPDQTNPNWSVKIADNNPLTSLPGTWVALGRSLMTSDRLTAWAEYEERIPFHTPVDVNQTSVKEVVLENVSPIVAEPAVEAVIPEVVAVAEPASQVSVTDTTPSTAEVTPEPTPEVTPTVETTEAPVEKPGRGRRAKS